MNIGWLMVGVVLNCGVVAYGQEVFTNGIDVSGNYVLGNGLVPLDVGVGGQTTNLVRDIPPTVGQMAGVDPGDGSTLENIDLLTLQPKKLDLSDANNHAFVISADQLSAGSGISIGYQGSNIVISITSGSISTSALDLTSVDSRYLLRSGDTILGSLDVAARVGVGTEDPKGMLHVTNEGEHAAGSALVLGPALLSGASNLRLGYDDNYSWIQSHGPKPLAINPFGSYVGIGTETPSALLDVDGTVKAKSLVVANSLEASNAVLNGTFITLDPWVDVRAFGAKGDGVTDDSDAFEAMVASGSGNYLVPWTENGYILNDCSMEFIGVTNVRMRILGHLQDNALPQGATATIHVKECENIVIDGEGIGCISGTGNPSLALRMKVWVEDSLSVTVENMTFKGGPHRHLFAENATNLIVRNVRSEDGFAPIYGSRCWDSTIEDCTVLNASCQGIVFNTRPAVAPFSQGNRIEGNYVRMSGSPTSYAQYDVGIALDNVIDGVCANNIVDGNYTATMGFSFASSSNILFLGNHLQRIATNAVSTANYILGVEIADTDYFSAQGNMFVDCWNCYNITRSHNISLSGDVASNIIRPHESANGASLASYAMVGVYETNSLYLRIQDVLAVAHPDSQPVTFVHVQHGNDNTSISELSITDCHTREIERLVKHNPGTGGVIQSLEISDCSATVSSNANPNGATLQLVNGCFHDVRVANIRAKYDVPTEVSEGDLFSAYMLDGESSGTWSFDNIKADNFCDVLEYNPNHYAGELSPHVVANSIIGTGITNIFSAHFLSVCQTNLTTDLVSSKNQTPVASVGHKSSYFISSSDISSIAPAFEGQLMYNSTSNRLYVATNLTASGWSVLAP